MVYLTEKQQIKLGQPKVISRRGHKLVVFWDTETCNYDRLIFDCSFRIVDITLGKAIEKYSFVVLDCYKTPKIIKGIFSRRKYKKYKPMLNSGEYRLITRQELITFINNMCQEYNITAFGAYNIEFDLQAMYNTLTYTNKRMKYFKKPLINDIQELELFNHDMLDIWANASVIFASKEYKAWYQENNYPLTKKGFMHTSVQYLKMFLAYKGLYQEQHTGQADISDELDLYLIIAILRYDSRIILNVSGRQMLALATLNKVSKSSKLYKDLVKYERFIPKEKIKA